MVCGVVWHVVWYGGMVVWWYGGMVVWHLVWYGVVWYSHSGSRLCSLALFVLVKQPCFSSEAMAAFEVWRCDVEEFRCRWRLRPSCRCALWRVRREDCLLAGGDLRDWRQLHCAVAQVWFRSVSRGGGLSFRWRCGEGVLSVQLGAAPLPDLMNLSNEAHCR